MKKLLVAAIIVLLAAVPLHRSEASQNASFKVFSIGLNVANTVPYSGSLYAYGPTSFSATLSPSAGSSYGPLTAGYYTFNVYTSAPGSRTFTLAGQSITTSQGYATFNVEITNTSLLTIY
ncbi:hypothetical protein MKQ70_13025 [Chitinophaga sedimenti]|uniref:hypothetical protein n=1 Tax=Chitinophaga sedimenti TaxID=2033606 RepID=UPI002002C5F4|nr:hypothetical protein [Chitinophaga sedimenti]MCK7555889.1 hypothetical protein [Chitinophaga sedimenti]